MFMVMLRCGLRVEEVARLTVDAVEYQRRQLFVANGKGAKDRMVYVSDDALAALVTYLEKRSSKARALFLVEKGPMKGKPISVRGIQKRIEYYARKSGVAGVVSFAASHHGHTATQCRRSALLHPGSPGTYPHHHDPALLSGREPQGAAGLPQRPWRWSCNGCRHWRKTMDPRYPRDAASRRGSDTTRVFSISKGRNPGKEVLHEKQKDVTTNWTP